MRSVPSPAQRSAAARTLVSGALQISNKSHTRPLTASELREKLHHHPTRASLRLCEVPAPQTRTNHVPRRRLGEHLERDLVPLKVSHKRLDMRGTPLRHRLILRLCANHALVRG